MSLKRLRHLLQRDIAMDLGTANTLIYVQGEGVVLDEPSVIAYSAESGNLLAVGHAAREFLGRTPPGIQALRPLKDGVIADYEATRLLIQALLRRAQERKGIFTPRIVIGVPTTTLQIEKRAVLEAAREAGAKKVFLLEETMAAAIGAGLLVEEDIPQMVVDVGGGTTEVAIISKWAFVHSEAIRVAGDEMDEAVANWLRATCRLEVGLTSAEEIKWEIGSAWPMEGVSESIYNVAGKDLLRGIPATVPLDADSLRPAFREPLRAIADLVSQTVDALDAETRVTVERNGLVLTGGGALLRGMERFLEAETGVPTRLTPDPLTTVVRGAGQTIEDFKRYKQVFIN